MKNLRSLFSLFARTRTALSSETGQTFAEHSLLLSLTGAISSAVGIMQGQYLIFVVVVMIALIFLLFWKPKYFLTVVFTAVILAVLMFVYRWVERGHF